MERNVKMINSFRSVLNYIIFLMHLFKNQNVNIITLLLNIISIYFKLFLVEHFHFKFLVLKRYFDKKKSTEKIVFF